MIVVGTNLNDMALAANRLAEVGGGVTVFSNGEELALVELPIAGLMSDERAEVVAVKAQRIVDAMATCGCTLNNAYMQHSLLALVVIPELRISDVGLVDVTTFSKTDFAAASTIAASSAAIAKTRRCLSAMSAVASCQCCAASSSARFRSSCAVRP